MEKIWLKHYPGGVPAEVRTDRYPSLLALLEESVRRGELREGQLRLLRERCLKRIEADSRKTPLEW